MKFKRQNMNSVVKISEKLMIMTEKLRKLIILILKTILGQDLRRALMR
jgi:hypothetical protein